MTTHRPVDILQAMLSILIVVGLGCGSSREDSISRNSRPDIILISIDTL